MSKPVSLTAKLGFVPSSARGASKDLVTTPSIHGAYIRSCFAVEPATMAA